MGVISENTGPVAAETSTLQTNQMAVLQNIWLELKLISMILKTAYQITDEDAELRNSITLTDLTLVR